MTPEQRAALEAAQKKMREALEAVRDAPDGTSDEDIAALEQTVTEATEEHDRIKSGFERRAAAAKALGDIEDLPEIPEPQTERTPAAGSDARVVSEPLTYGRRAGIAGQSFIRDLVQAYPPAGEAPNADAQQRLQRHRQEMSKELRASSTTDTTSIGEMVPPLWLVEEFAAIARAGRPLCNAIGSRPLPQGTENIIVPKVTTGGSVHFQTAQNTAIATQDMVTGGTAQATVKTVAGEINTSLQSVEFSPINMVDGFFLPELASLHANRMETTIGGATVPTNGWPGIIGTSGTQAVTYTSAAPTAGSLYAKLADGIQQMHTARYLPPDLIVMHPRRWGWLLAQSDSTGRPLVVPFAAQGPMNSTGTQDGVISQSFVGTMQGLPVLTSAAAIPTNDAAGTTNDVVLIVRRGDLWLWESDIRTRVLYEVLSGALSVKIQLYNYSAFMPDRYPTAISSIRGTGLSTPTFP
ncbi:MAG: phage major capsid protein [Thermoleophilia bacterium]